MNRPSTIALKCILTPTMEGYLAYSLGNAIVFEQILMVHVISCCRTQLI